MSGAFLSLGGNLGDREKTLAQAVRELDSTSGIHVNAASSLYETDPVGKTDQPSFFNAVVQIETDLTPEAPLAACQGIESRMGRVRTERWGPRTLDVDILTFDDVQIQTPDLILPHPRMAERAFVQVPLRELRDRHIEWEDGVRPVSFCWCPQVTDGPRWIHRTCTGSTNEDLRELAEGGLPDGSLLISDEQTAGRGRMNRFWQSGQSQGMWMSVLFRPGNMPAQDIGLVPLAVGLGVVHVLRAKGVDAGLKWPNDILVSGRKICGILCESRSVGSDIRYIVAGIGLNLSQSDDAFGALSDIAVSVRQARPDADPMPPEVWAGRILFEIRKTVTMIATDRTALLQACRARSILTGHTIEAMQGAKIIQGTVQGIADDGSLEIQTADGLRVLSSGDITLHGPGGTEHGR